MTKFRKGELDFYKSSTPKELKEQIKRNPETEEFIEAFLDKYDYNYTKQKWELK